MRTRESLILNFSARLLTDSPYTRFAHPINSGWLSRAYRSANKRLEADLPSRVTTDDDTFSYLTIKPKFSAIPVYIGVS